MQKKLIALAIAGAIAAPAAMAADGVTIYGQLDVSYDSIRTDADTANGDTVKGTLSRVSSNASRIGFKGKEDLGNGTYANWQIEQQVDLDAGGNTWATRNTFVGLGGGFGEVRLGKMDTPHKMSTGALDPFADTMGDYNTIIGNGGLGSLTPYTTNLTTGAVTLGTTRVYTGSSDWERRANNTIAYISPNMSGLTAAVAYVAGAETDINSTPQGRAWSLGLMYSNGPIYAGLGWEKNYNDSTVYNATTVPATYTGTYQQYMGAFIKNDTSTRLGVGYDFGVAKVGLVMDRIQMQSEFESISRNAYLLNVVAPVTAAVDVKAAYGKAKSWSGTSDTGATNWVVGVDYKMSKRTKLYALYTKTDNQTNGGYGIGQGAGGSFYNVAAGQAPSAFSLGVRHSF